jgi:hypothetical protein
VEPSRFHLATVHWAAFAYLCLFTALVVSGPWHHLKSREDCRLSVAVAIAELIVLVLASRRHVTDLLPRQPGLAVVALAVALTVLDFVREYRELRKEADFEPRRLACPNVAFLLLLLPAYAMAVANVLDS